MRELIFNVEQEEEGGYSAAAEGELIFTQGETWKELCANVQEAVEAHFFAAPHRKPEKIQLLLRQELPVA